MPHQARKVSSSGYYHVVSKGIHNQNLFFDDADRRYYLSLLSESKESTKMLLHAYCLMANHVHLVVEDSRNTLPDFMKHLDERYGPYLNEQTDRVGAVFRRPFWSEPIVQDSHLLCAVRYIHANPAAAGICKASQYEWSSAKDYLGRSGIADTETVLRMLGGRDRFIEWSQPRNNTAEPFPGSTLRGHLSDNEVRRMAQSILSCDVRELASLPADEQFPHLVLLHERGLTYTQISSVTGIPARKVRWLLAER